MMLALATNLDQSRAIAALHRRGWRDWLRTEPPSRVALVLVPFWTVAINVEAVSFRDRYRLSFDALTGSLDPYRSGADELPPLSAVEKANRPEPLLSDAALTERAITYARREVYRKGFGRIRDLNIQAERVPEADFHVPYWLGFYGASDGTVELSVMNANSGKREGKKAVALFAAWLARK
jgi:hypothetical protein